MVFSLKSAVKPSKRSRVLVRKETTAAYLFLLPSLIFFLGFVIFPIVKRVVKESDGDFYAEKKNGTFTVKVRLNCEN